MYLFLWFWIWTIPTYPEHSPTAMVEHSYPSKIHVLKSYLLRRLERGREIGREAMQETKALISRWWGNLGVVLIEIAQLEFRHLH